MNLYIENIGQFFHKYPFSNSVLSWYNVKSRPSFTPPQPPPLQQQQNKNSNSIAVAKYTHDF